MDFDALQRVRKKPAHVIYCYVCSPVFQFMACDKAVSPTQRNKPFFLSELLILRVVTTQLISQGPSAYKLHATEHK
jgi:hypothetical protein